MAARRAMSGCSQGAGLARTVAARKARALSGLMARPAHGRPRPRCRTACPYDPAPTFLNRTCVWLGGALSGLMERPAPRPTPPALPNGPPLPPPPHFFKPYLCVAWWRVERLDGEARPTSDPARGAERPARTTPPQLFPKPSPVLYLARALSGLMAGPAPRPTPPAVPNGLPL